MVPERAGERKEGLLHKELLYPEKGTDSRETMQLDLSIRRHPSVRDMINYIKNFSEVQISVGMGSLALFNTFGCILC